VRGGFRGFRELRGEGSWATALAVALVVFVAFTVIGCQPAQPPAAPAIEFTTIPEALEGGPQAMTQIAGRVSGAKPGQRIVLFARSGVWWLQPDTAKPFTTIQPDSTWRSPTHFGFEYAALLVGSAYVPPSTLDSLPVPGGDVIAVATTKGTPSTKQARKTLQFSGYEWEVRQSASERGGTLSLHDASNAWVDDHGFLHLRIAKRDADWTNAEVTLTRSLGYGTYMFVVRDTSALEPAAAFSMFTWDPGGGDPNHREMDIEIARWGDPANKNAQFVVQPYYVPANVVRFAAPAGLLTHSFRWEPGRVLFKTVKGGSGLQGAPTIAEHLYTSGVPSPGAEAIRLALYVFTFTAHPLKNGAEVVVEKFLYLP
jgi:hypothetical protein